MLSKVSRFFFRFSFSSSSPTWKKCSFLFFGLAILFRSFFCYRRMLDGWWCAIWNSLRSHLATFILLLWCFCGWREDSFLCVGALACTREPCQFSPSPFHSATGAREVEKASSRAMLTRTAKSTWRFYFSRLHMTHYQWGDYPSSFSSLSSPLQIPLAIHICDNSWHIWLYSHLPISKNIPPNLPKHHLNLAIISNLYFSPIMNSSASDYVPHTSSLGTPPCVC